VRRGPSGRYETSTTAGETVRAFVPFPLPPDPHVELGGARAALLERALVACGRLDGITALLPHPELFLYAYVRREAVLSSQIEGTQSSLSDLLLFEAEQAPGVPFDDVREVSNYVRALEHGVQRIQEGFPLSNRLIREIHGVLLESGRGAEKQPGEFRRSQNWIGGTRPGNAHFVPPPVHEVESCMGALEAFLHAQNDGLATLVRAAMAHAQFETIHPFLDGNGRTGRLLISLMLFESGLLRDPLLYLSLYFKQHRDEYYRQLDSVRTQGDWEAWLDFFLEGVVMTAGQAVDTAHRLLRLFEDSELKAQGLGRSAANVLRVLGSLRSRPVATIQGLAARSGVSYPTAARAVESLQQIQIVSEITGRRRERVFAYREYLDILNEGAEPL
jgi:Fic family protein